MRPSYYKLLGKLPVPCADVIEWAKCFRTANRRVAETTVGPLRVSTVFLGIDHSFGGPGDPLLFETMIFGGDPIYDWLDAYMDRCSTWEQAEQMHLKAVEWAEARLREAESLL